MLSTSTYTSITTSNPNPNINGITNATLEAMLAVSPTAVIGSAATTGTLTWSFNSVGQAFDYLEQGETLTLAYVVRVTDSASATADQTVTITITGTNNAPVLTIVGASVNEAADASAQDLSLSGSLQIADKDVGNSVSATQGTPTVVWSGGTVPAGYDLAPLTANGVLTLGAATTTTGGIPAQHCFWPQHKVEPAGRVHVDETSHDHSRVEPVHADEVPCAGAA